MVSGSSGEIQSCAEVIDIGVKLPFLFNVIRVLFR